MLKIQELTLAAQLTSFNVKNTRTSFQWPREVRNDEGELDLNVLYIVSKHSKHKLTILKSIIWEGGFKTPNTPPPGRPYDRL